MNETQFIESLSVLEFKEGDTLILKVPHILNHGEIKAVTAAVRACIGMPDAKVMVLSDGMDIGILREGNDVE